jgi:hypothetical protein
LEHAEGISGDEVPDDQLAIIARRKKNVGVEWVDGEDVDLESLGRRMGKAKRKREEEEEEREEKREVPDDQLAIVGRQKKRGGQKAQEA